MGPQDEEVVFLVDTGASRSSLSYVPNGLQESEQQIIVTGIKGVGFPVSVFEPTTLKLGQRVIEGQLLYIPEIGSNLLGRDFILQLRLDIKANRDPRGPVVMAVLTEEREKTIDPEVWAQEGNRGGLKIDPLKITLKQPGEVVCQKQYPIPLEGKRGLQPVIEGLIKDGLLEPCMSPYNTPVLPVRKTDGSYRLVQDLRKLNQIVQVRHPVVPNPYTLLSKIPHDHKWFSVIDLKDAFWACPLDEESRDLFAFEWEDPNTGRKQQFRWTVLPQGFTESPNLFGQVLEQVLEGFKIPSGISLLQYVDDLLLSGTKERAVFEATKTLLNFLGQQGLRVSKTKLQCVEKEVKYLGHLISEGKRRINPERIKGIVELPLPRTKKELRKFLGLTGYCRLWVESYAQKTKPLYLKLTEGEPERLLWEPEETDLVNTLKKDLMTAPVLALPSLDKPFHLFVTVNQGTALGVLTQRWGGKRQPIAYLSKLLDPVSRGWPECVQAIAATAELVEESRKLTFGGALVVSTPHQVRTILTQRAGKWLTDSRILKYEAVLMEKNDLVLTVDSCVNPATFLWKGEGEGQNPEHNCVEIIELQTKVRPDLRDVPLHKGTKLFIDGSSRVIEGKRHNGYSIIDGLTLEEVESGRLPNDWSAQTCELYALNQALKVLKNKDGTIYTDSKYGYGIVHTFGKIWTERGLINSKGKELVHEALITQILENLLVPEEIAVVHVSGHQKGSSLEARGNRLADEIAKRASLQPGEGKIQAKTEYLLCLVPQVPSPGSIPQFSEKERADLIKIGAIQTEQGKWILPDGREMVNKQIMREIMAILHQGSHWGVQALCDTVLRKYGCIGMFTVAKQICERCEICRKINKKIIKKQPMGGREPGLRPFQAIQVDYTELPPVGQLKYLLVMVDHLTGWVEAFPVTRATANNVSKIILEQILPRYGLVETIDSDMGSHFSSKVLQSVMETLGISWEFHAPWSPSSSGRVERMNQTIKKQLAKLMYETKLPWTKCLPLALLRIRTAPRKDVGLSPYELLFGLPYTGLTGEKPQTETKDRFLKDYILGVLSSVSFLRKQGLLAQRPPLDFAVHPIKPGEWVLIKSWKETKLQPEWEGPFQVLLTTETAVRTRERGWSHYTRVKAAPKPTADPQWTCHQHLDEPLKLTLSRTGNN